MKFAHLSRDIRLLAVCCVWLFHGCVANTPVPDDPAYAPVISAGETPRRLSDGSLYQGNAGMSLFSDRKAMRVGDILTIQLNERTIASKSAESGITKNNELDLDAGAVAGVTPSFGQYSMETAITHDREFEAKADADQKNSLIGSIAVTIVDILPNGLLVVRGEKWMTLTNGEEFIRVKGLVRPQDIGPDNTIASTKLADARISYSGTGDLADANRQGWLSKVFNSVFWPF